MAVDTVCNYLIPYPGMVSTEQNEIQRRLNMIKGQISGVEEMISQKRDCVETVVQLQAVRASLASLAEHLLAKEAQVCMDDRSVRGRARMRKLITNFFRFN